MYYCIRKISAIYIQRFHISIKKYDTLTKQFVSVYIIMVIQTENVVKAFP